jgi:hypothetical protein
MKKLITLFISLLPLTLFAETANDTIISLNGNDIEIIELDDQINVKVYDTKTAVEKEMVFEGHYKDGRSREKGNISRTYLFLLLIGTVILSLTGQVLEWVLLM